ncbi:Cdc4 and related F-box and WD-40 proteins [Phaffia rhodozyma]|uniref:Cdc4 and related F-box and WD-40 proteins n=1 Tax=Phaffia rhodozyma TaxID=264483 RepID=A0A0F7SHZ7_PHARH|nr:Cdc4 and related F-box and WD-40 proteins [Phaffia rhodozyma]
MDPSIISTTTTNATTSPYIELPSTHPSTHSYPLAMSIVPSLRDSVCERPPAHAENDDQAPDLALFRKGKKLCVRHEKMADEGINANLQASLDALPLADRQAINAVWSTFSSSNHSRREIILKGLLTMCCFSQLSLLSTQVQDLIRLDPFDLFPREVSLKVLSYLDAFSLGKAVQVSKHWRSLADDDFLWRGMCAQHIERKCTKCGWGLPLLERRRLRLEIDGHYEDSAPSSPTIHALEATSLEDNHSHHLSHQHHHHHHHHHHLDQPHIPLELAGPENSSSSSSCITTPSTLQPPSPSNLHQIESGPVSPRGAKRDSPGSEDEANDSSSSHKRATPSDRSFSRGLSTSPPPSSGGRSQSASLPKRPFGPCRTLTRPWKEVYTERLTIERNWRKGRYTVNVLKGHTDGVMCLQVLSGERFKLDASKSRSKFASGGVGKGIMITGSYDRTARVWDLESGKEVLCMRGHARGIRALQFDEAILITGSMDHTMKIWNWRTGVCIRTLGGHTDGVVSLNYDKNVLASGSADSTIKIWNFRTGDCFTLRGHRDWVNSVVLWDGSTSSSASSFSHDWPSTSTAAPTPPPVTSTGIDPGKMLFSGSDDGTIRLWDLNTKDCVRIFEGHVGQVQSLRLCIVDRDRDEEEEEEETAARAKQSADSRERGSGHYEPNPLGVYGTPSHSLPAGPHLMAHHPSINPTDPRMSTPPLGDFSISNPSNSPKPTKPARSRVDEKQALLMSASLDNTVRVWDVETGKTKKTLFGHIEGVWSVDADPLRVVSSSHDRTIKVWSREDGKCSQTLVGHREAVTCLSLTDTQILSGSEDGEVRIWNFGA